MGREISLKAAVRAEMRWHMLLTRTLRAAMTDRVSLAAAGCAFYATLALFPAISMLISIGGLVLNPKTAAQELGALSGLLPAPAFTLISDRVHELVRRSGGSLSLHLAVSFLLTFWSTSTGVKSVLSAINVAYDATDKRPFVGSQVIGLAMTLVAIMSVILTVAVLLLLPQAIAFLGFSRHGAVLVHAAGLTMLTGFFFLGMVLLYRFGPCRPRPHRLRTKAGATLATVLWLTASEGLSFYVSRLGTFGATYGSLGAAVGVMLWFFVSAYAVLLGAELNARLEEADKNR